VREEQEIAIVDPHSANSVVQQDRFGHDDLLWFLRHRSREVRAAVAGSGALQADGGNDTWADPHLKAANC